MIDRIDTPWLGCPRLHHQTRRHFFADCGVGLGAAALSSLLAGERAALAGGESVAGGEGDQAARAAARAPATRSRPRPGHFPRGPRA